MKRVFQYVAMFNLFMVMITPGYLEHNLLLGIVLSLVFLALFILFAKLGGMFYEKK